MKCMSCDGLGFIEQQTLGSTMSGVPRVNVMKCSTCKDDAKYSAEISRRYKQKRNEDHEARAMAPLKASPFANLRLIP